MATIAIPRPVLPHPPESTLDTPITPPLSFDGTNSPPMQQQDYISKVPNKHIPVCPTGPAQPENLHTPPSSPKELDNYHQRSALFPPDCFTRSESGVSWIYQLDAQQVAEAVTFAAQQPLPHAFQVFPWFHGLHSQNHLQQTFFSARKRSFRKPPSCLRGVTLVKADGRLDVARLKGALAVDEFMREGTTPSFYEVDPREGFCVRNFHIQPAKVALTSDIIVYGDDAKDNLALAHQIVTCQRRWREKCIIRDGLAPEYNTFVCTSNFSEFEENFGHLVAIDSAGNATGEVLDFVHQERREMWEMSVASEISHNVFLGPTPELGSPEEQQFDLLVECSDAGRLNPAALKVVAETFGDIIQQPFHDFPSSGSILPPTWSHEEADGIIDTCKWIYHIAHGYCLPDSNITNCEESDGEAECSPPRKILIHCADGYTESTMLAIAYFSYSTGRTVSEAWLDLHTERRRNFFAYPTDVALLKAISNRLLQESPVCSGISLQDISSRVKQEPRWMSSLDGSFPSRVLDYLYLGNLSHANNPDLLRAMGIYQILSVGETAIWRDGELEQWGTENVCVVEGVQDNGIDPLTGEFARCLDFIGEPVCFEFAAPGVLALLPYMTNNWPC